MFRDQERYGLDPTKIVRTKTWGEPLKWQRKAEAEGVFELVFTCSWSDFFIEEADPWRKEAWAIIKKCKNLLWQILTKRPELMPTRMPEDWGDGYPNVALGVSVETEKYLFRVDQLRAVPARVRFISAEPLLGPLPKMNLEGIDQVITGGESGPDFRPMDLDWVRDIRDQCLAKDVAFFHKQGAALLPGTDEELDGVKWQQQPKAWVA